jgi:predicted PurR-regulated permease PerM
MIVKFSEHPLSFSAIFRIIISILGVYLVWKASQVILIIIISVMLATALYPIAMKLNKKLPLIVAALIVVLLLILPFIIIAATVLPSLYTEFPKLIKLVNSLFSESTFLPEQLRNVDFNQYTRSGGEYLIQSTGAITNFVGATLGVFVLTFFLIVDSERLMNIFLTLFKRNKRIRIKNLLIKLSEINGQFIRGNLLISLICGIIIFIGLSILQVPYALPLALFIAILDLLPLIGSTIGAIPAILLGFSISPVTGLLVIALVIAYQQVEGTIIAPVIYNKALKLSPSLSFLAVLIGSALFGLVGAFLALPFAASLPAVTEYIHDEIED